MQAAVEQSAPSGGEYEFGPAENSVIGSCGGRARVWGILCIVSGAIQIIASIFNIAGVIKGNGALFMLPAGAFNVVLGVYFTRAGSAFMRVVTTQGNDVTLMMGALRNLARALLVQIVATIVFILIVSAMVIMMLVFLGALQKAG